MIMFLNRVQNLIELVLILFGHILKVVLEGASVVSHPLHLKFYLSVHSNRLLIGNHFLVNLMAELT